MLTARSTLPLQKEKANKMPYKSDAQRRFFNVNRSKMEKQGVDVDEWNNASKGKDLPARAPRKSSLGQKIGRKSGS